MNITILGCGAIGSLWAHHLTDAGHATSLWQRSPTSSNVTLSLGGDSSRTFATNSISHLNNADLLLITVKAWQVKHALAPLLQYLEPETILVFMHNGMGAIDELPADIHTHPIVVATTTHGAYKASQNNVLHTGLGSTTLGGYNLKGSQCHFLSDVFNHALPKAIWHNNINEALWHKLAINCVINPLTALHNCSNGELLKAQFSAPIEAIVAEISRVMNAENIAITQTDLLITIQHVAHATSNNKSSMQQDITYKRPTEIDYITGYLCRVANQHYIDVPVNQDLYNRIRAIELSWS